MKVIVLQITGYGFLVLGVLGLFLPFLQGFLFILIGLLILAKHAAWAHNLLQRFRERHPKAVERIERAEARVVDWWHGFTSGAEARMADWWRRFTSFWRCSR